MSRQDLAVEANDPFDPFSAPQTSIRPIPTLGGSGGEIPFSLGSVLSRTWAIFSARPMLCVGVYATGTLLNFAGQWAITEASQAISKAAHSDSIGGLFYLAGTLGIMILGFWLAAGQTLALLNLARGRSASLGNLFEGTPFLVAMIVSSFVLGFLGAALMMLGILPGVAAMVLMGMGAVEPTTILLFALGLLVGTLIASIYWVYFSQYFFVVVDRPALGAVGSLKESMRITRGKFWSISLIYLVTILVNLLGMLALFIGLIVTIPFTFLMLAVMYVALASERPLAAN